MAQTGFPQIPSTVWWGMRGLLKQSPSAKYDESMIGAKLGVQPAAARQYFAELKRAGILDDDGKPTDLGGRWRLDDSYEQAVNELIQELYPESLVTIAPPGNADRSVVKNWFMGQGLGEGAARNKTATYLLISSTAPTDINASNNQSQKTETTKAAKKSPARSKRAAPAASKPSVEKSTKTGDHVESDGIPLNVNVQIHISADASTEQIDSIFKSMRQHLYDQ